MHPLFRFTPLIAPILLAACGPAGTAVVSAPPPPTRIEAGLEIGRAHV
jgi:hypothetical protein